MTDAYDISYEGGKAAAMAFDTSPHFTQFPRHLAAADCMKLFLPPIDEGTEPMQMARPFPANYREWMRGFNDGRSETCQN